MIKKILWFFGVGQCLSCDEWYFWQKELRDFNHFEDQDNFVCFECDHDFKSDETYYDDPDDYFDEDEGGWMP